MLGCEAFGGGILRALHHLAAFSALLLACSSTPHASGAPCAAIVVREAAPTSGEAAAPTPADPSLHSLAERREVGAYLTHVQRMVLAKWRPAGGRRGVDVDFAIRADGCVSHLAITGSPSKSDRAAVLRAFERSQPLPSPLEGLADQELNATFEQTEH